MSIETFTDPTTGATVTRVPMSMTGVTYRKHMGIPEHWMGVKKSFHIRQKFRGIKVKNRLAYLKKMVNVVRKDMNLNQVQFERTVFNKYKFHNFPIAEKQPCYCCVKNIAVLRHHVIPLANGGRSKENNIVPLCKDCHEKVHPHLRKRGLKKLGGAVASRHSVFPKINGPVVVNPDGVIVSNTAQACVIAPQSGCVTSSRL